VKHIAIGPVRRIALIGNSLPRKCGIATFTTDLQQAIVASRPHLEAVIAAMNDGHQVYDYPQAVGVQIDDKTPKDYNRAADFLNAGEFDAISLQHEFGIFGGFGGETAVKAAGVKEERPVKQGSADDAAFLMMNSASGSLLYAWMHGVWLFIVRSYEGAEAVNAFMQDFPY